ncbi:MAG: hypothetical protein IT385_20215 [Deltaproteobacteria bacterium]|nr:hypothetical protein [Deltaproteobacteria bacterium]
MKTLTMTIALGLLTLVPLTPTASRAGERCHGAVCEVGIPSDKVHPITASQRMSQWCWAASIAMIFDYHGHPVSQEAIVRATYGGLVDLPAFDGPTMTDALARPWTDARGASFRARVKVFDLGAGRFEVDTRTVIAELRAERPLLVGTAGHAMVVTAMRYRETAWGEPEVLGVTVRDPWPGQGRRELGWHEMEPTYVAAVSLVGPRASEAPAPREAPPEAPSATPEVEEEGDDLCIMVHMFGAEVCGELAEVCEALCP